MSPDLKDRESNSRSSRRLSLWVGGLLLLGCVCVPFARKVAWVGTRELSVHIVLVDGETLKPIRGAEVSLFDRFELSLIPPEVWKREMLVPGPNAKVAKTDKDGLAEFQHQFHSAGSHYFGLERITSKGYVDTARTWIHVAAKGRPAVLMPVATNRINPRPLNDDAPLHVTIVLGETAKGQ